MPDDTLSIGELARRTGLPSATLRVWETRYGFPRPGRDASGRRAYRPEIVGLLQQVVDDRRSGLGLSAAIARAQTAEQAPTPSLNAFLRRREPTLPIHRMTKHQLAVLTRALEDEGHARAGRTTLIVAGFQRSEHYRRVQERWDDLVSSAGTAYVLSDFATPSDHGGRPVRVPVDRSHPLHREWFVIWCSDCFSACLSGRELPGQASIPDRHKVLETVWTLDGNLVAEAARSVLDVVREMLDDPAEVVEHGDSAHLNDAEQLDISYAVTNRVLMDPAR